MKPSEAECPPSTGVGRSDDFDNFVLARSPDLFRTAIALTGDAALAEDLLQTALVQTWRSWERVHTSHEAFVRRTMVNTYVSWWRRKWNGERPTADLPEAIADRIDSEARLLLNAAISRLPRRQRAVIALRYYEDLPDKEIAELLNCSASTVRSQAHRALARLSNDVSLQEAK